MSSWPSKRKKSGRAHIFKNDCEPRDRNKAGTSKKISSGKIRAKQKQELRRETEQLNNETNTVDYVVNYKNILSWS